MLPRHHPDRIRIAFDDHRLVANAGLILPATLARRLGLARIGPQPSRPWPRHGPGEHGRQDDDPGCVCAGWRRLHRRRRRVAHRWDRPHPGQHSQGAVHPGHLPAQLQVGPCPPTGPGEPGVAGLGPGPLRPAPATRHSPSTSIPPSAKPTDWPRRVPATTATPVHGAITRCWPSPPEPATC